jgi:hypothetical protein
MNQWVSPSRPEVKAMIKRLTLLVFMLLVSTPVFAESVDTAWVKRYNGPIDSTDVAKAIVIDDSDYVIVTGESYGNGANLDVATIKYSFNGETSWIRRYNGPANGDDGANAIAVDGSGNIIVVGYSLGTGTYWDYVTIKYLSSGDTAWVRRYNGPVNGDDRAIVVTTDRDGNVYVSGQSIGDGSGYDFVTIKYFPNGDTAWVRRYNGPRNELDYVRGIDVDDSGNVYVTGWSSGPTTYDDYVTIKYLSDGDTAWVRTYNGPNNTHDEALAIAMDNSDNVYVTGWSTGIGTMYDYATIKYLPNGDTVWVRRYNGPANGNDVAVKIAIDGNHNVYVTGYSDSTGSSQDYATVKYDSSGNEIWVRRFDCANGTDMPADMAIDGSNNIYVTGHSGCGGATSFDYVTIKYYPNGDTTWLRKYQGPVYQGSDYAYALAVDTSGGVYVTGKSQGEGTDYDYTTIKYVKKPSGVEEETERSEKPSEFDLSQNYPNPFNPTTKIEFTLSKSGFVTLRIYDILGREVKTLVSEHLSAGYKSVIWDGKNDEGKDVASGVYFYQLKVGDFSQPKKMLLLK